MKLVRKAVETNSIITKTDIPVCDYAVNPYVGRVSPAAVNIAMILLYTNLRKIYKIHLFSFKKHV